MINSGRETLDIIETSGQYGLLIIPEKLAKEVKGFREQVENFQAGKTDPVRFRAYRVPMGVYEQRENNTYMARLRLPGGVATAGQLEKMAELSEKYGRSLVHLTTRQDIQLHNLKLEVLPDVMEELLKVGLVCRGGGGNTVRNITASALAGVDPAAPFDILPYALQVTEYLLPFDSSYQLPRKFKIAFVSNPAEEKLTRIADLGLIACCRDGQDGFAVYAGGGMGAHSRAGILIEEFIPAEDAIIYAEATKRVFDRHGHRADRHHARLRFVLERFGEDKFRETLKDMVEKVRAEALDFPGVRFQSPIAPGGQELDSYIPYVLPSKIPGRYNLRFRPILGDLSAPQLRQIADLMRKEGVEFRADVEQGFYLIHVRGESVSEIRGKLSELVNPFPAAAPVACAGASTCRLGVCRSRGLALAVHEAVLSLSQERQEKLPAIKISGCPNSCGQHALSDLGFCGAAKRINGRLMPFYQVFVKPQGDGALSRRVGDLPARAVPEFLTGLDSLENIETHLAKFQTYPPYAEAPEYYRDWGAEEDFSLAGRGPGECGAGVMDVIALDIKTAEDELEHNKDSEGLYKAAISAMRALLITHGIDTQKPREIMNAFQKYFITPGWVSRKSEQIIQGLLDYRLGDLATLEDFKDDIHELVARVRDLYNSLDSNLKFRIEPLKEGIESENMGTHDLSGLNETEIYRIDLRRTPCPINFMMAKVELERIPIGKRLEIYLDEGEPIDNVPASFQKQGQEVVELGDAPEKGKRVVIERKH
ncbi:MAG: sulfurtransferase TusA family protein [Candidatus Tectomicrobia bacterium]|uniref:Sulfurtransferase TusA family protein n=1 Tax=Tectimicrobiota bacterium TaxID=2528274 RepID=A0A933LR35_UNCTE|nr:sulfurtransferase TusA family protein [Candidatus Tectomicrobia bacterium]